jgi:hypothetical protein
MLGGFFNPQATTLAFCHSEEGYDHRYLHSNALIEHTHSLTHGAEPIVKLLKNFPVL